jgi:hypothetical protein
VLRNIVDEYRARIASTNGQVGGFLHTEIVPLLSPGARVLYLGDQDLCGNDIENNTKRVLERKVGPLEWERLALTEAQVIEYDLPKIKKPDHRFKPPKWHYAVETEAISQRILIEILRARLDELLPEPLARVQERETRQQKRIAKLLSAQGA